MDRWQQELVVTAAACAENAFCLYSKQRLGVSVLGTDGKIYKGCSFDSAAFPCSICGAHVAVAQAATQGRALVKQCAVVQILSKEERGEGQLPLKGCCLEWLCQYAHPEEVHIHSVIIRKPKTQEQKEVVEISDTYKLSDLLPYGRRLPSPFPPRPDALFITTVLMDEGHEADEEAIELFKAAAKAAEGSCCWNSGVSVGCAILTEEGIVTGANAETTALGIGCCAEQNAIGFAAALGRKKFLKAVIFCPTMPESACHPCGRCLQLLMQAQERTRVAATATGEQELVAPADSKPELLLIMPWQETTDGQTKWRLKTRRLDDMGGDDRFML